MPLPIDDDGDFLPWTATVPTNHLLLVSLALLQSVYASKLSAWTYTPHVNAIPDENHDTNNLSNEVPGLAVRTAILKFIGGP